MEKVIIASAVRTPFDKFGGLMRSETTVQLGSTVVKEIIKRDAEIKKVAMNL